MGSLYAKNMDHVCNDISQIYNNHIDIDKRIGDLELLLLKYHTKREQKFINKCIKDLKNE